MSQHASGAAVFADWQRRRKQPRLQLVLGLPDDLVLAELRQQPYPCPVCRLGPVRPESRGMRITNVDTGEVVHDSTPGGPDAA